MKYIRTEKGIYDIETAPIVYVDGVKCVEFWTGRFTSRYEKIIQEANTIEELCDEFVVFDKEQPNGKLLYYKGFENLKNEFIDFENIKYKVEIYGAIWTKLGLEYVAKMDNEGKLCLI